MGLEIGPGEAFHVGAWGDDGLVGIDVVAPSHVGGGAEGDEGGSADGDAKVAESTIWCNEEIESLEDAGHFV